MNSFGTVPPLTIVPEFNVEGFYSGDIAGALDRTEQIIKECYRKAAARQAEVFKLLNTNTIHAQHQAQ